MEIQDLCSRLQQLDVYGIDERIQAISKQITDREAQFRNEEKAKKEFLSGQDILSSSSYQVEKRFSRARHRLPEYERAYCIDEKYINDRNGLKGVIENVNLLKNRLDSYTGTGRKESYTVIVRVRNERRSGRRRQKRLGTTMMLISNPSRKRARKLSLLLGRPTRNLKRRTYSPEQECEFRHFSLSATL